MAKEIVFISGKDPLVEIGGHSSYVRAHARAAIRLGFEPHIFCVSSAAGIIPSEFGVVHRVATPFRPFRPMMTPFHSPLMSAAVERFLAARNDPILIHGFALAGYAGLSAARNLRRRGRKASLITNVYTTIEHEARGKLNGVNHNHGFSRRFQHLVEYAWTIACLNGYERRLYTGSQLVIINYASVRRLVSARYDDAVKMRQTPYASEMAFLCDRSEQPAAPDDLAALKPSGAPLLVAVSRQDPRKGVDVLLRALAELKSRGVAFRACIVGGGLLLEAHRRLAERLGLGESVLLTGRVPDSYQYLQHADVFVLPSLQEGSGSVSLLEALQAGAAIVASDLDGIPEDVTDGDSALLVPTGDAAALSLALERALTDAELRQQLRRRARETFAEKFSAEAFTAALRVLYAELGFEGERG
ncbi:MAG: glycosyltransferase family 4 protein [Blastocatellales bacterium]